MKRIISICLIFTLLTSMLAMPSLAASGDALWSSLQPGDTYTSEPSLSPREKELIETFSTMSVSELNDYISNGLHNLEIAASNEDDEVATLKGLWLAAASIASSVGYPLAATLVRNSVIGNDYNEYNGDFSAAIKASSEYRTWASSSSKEESIVFTSGDLFYALHIVGIGIASSSSQGAIIAVTDTFDFKTDYNMQNLFACIINDWAALCQSISVLEVIEVEIRFDA